MSLIERMESNVRAHGLFRPRARVLVAVSGGLDSMVLLHLLHALTPAWGWRLVVAHFNHRLRGPASRADERLVRTTAERFFLPCVVEAGDVKGEAARDKLSLEVAARRLRHAFLARAARAQQARHIVLAHHADDQVELFFLRLLRGAGGDGLAGMHWTGPSPVDERLALVRPLLDIGKAELLDYARTHRIRYRTDATNECLKMDRNRIRHRLLPLLERQFQPNLTEVIGREMTVLRDESEFLNALASEWLAAKDPAPWDDLAVALQRRCLQRQLHEMHVPVAFDLVESLRLHPGRQIMVGPAMTVCREANGRVNYANISRPTFVASEMSVTLQGRAGLVEFGRRRFAWAVEPVMGTAFKLPQRKPGLEWFDAGRVGSSIVLRHWQAGDRFQPIGLKHSVKLQDLMTNAKIPGEKRRTLIVAATARGEIWWVEGMRMAERFKLRPGTKRRLRWSWNVQET